MNDVWALDVSDPNALTWTEWKTKGDIPQKKGYHTANLIGDKMVVFGGSDGHASFADVHVLNLSECRQTSIGPPSSDRPSRDLRLDSHQH